MGVILDPEGVLFSPRRGAGVENSRSAAPVYQHSFYQGCNSASRMTERRWRTSPPNSGGSSSHSSMTVPKQFPAVTTNGVHGGGVVQSSAASNGGVQLSRKFDAFATGRNGSSPPTIGFPPSNIQPMTVSR